ncbi:MAG TPA: hypothetical protein VNT60_10550, partial [Deinococcales bacterium]|nr:hypothetical protein [Deinococcales bacterium]
MGGGRAIAGGDREDLRRLALTGAAVASLLLGALSLGQVGPAPQAPRVEVAREAKSGAVTVTDLWYWSGGKRVAAVVCRPGAVPSGETLPVVLYEHGGFEGITGRDACLA